MRLSRNPGVYSLHLWPAWHFIIVKGEQSSFTLLAGFKRLGKNLTMENLTMDAMINSCRLQAF
jgi:hypothetical protein